MLIVEQNAMDEMVADAVHSFPDECCGFLFGKENGNDRVITKIFPVNNAREGDKRRRFEISPRDYINAEILAEENGFQLLGVYHSHPDHPPVPSEQDRIAAQPYFSYIILSVLNREFDSARSWRLGDDLQFEEEKIEPIIIIQ
jgi:proteasome lid subunit RPN8/RPN11